MNPAGKMIFDTGASLCYLPQSEYQIFISKIQENTQCAYHTDDDMFYCECDSEDDSRFPTLSFIVGSGTQH
jgi:hypothetical protein